MRILPVLLLAVSTHVFGQGIKVEYDKKHDVSKYKTFSFGESQVITPPDQKKVSDATIDKWIKNGVRRELEFKGLQWVDNGGDLTVTYAVGTMSRSDVQAIGPLGQTPGSSATTWSRDYNQTSLIMDLNNKNNFLVWRINAVADVITDGERTVDLIVERGFKKFGKAAKKKK
ncbi:MAG TPA: DUF4136 domain-containing protein [Cyclobacteriaceae bacterium]|nr:DUF4136 domain-containing protein [Cyclobacteriaceae bacterium]